MLTQPQVESKLRVHVVVPFITAFNSQSMPLTREVVKEQLVGKVHLSLMSLASMSQYKNVIPIKDINVKIPVINVTANVVLCEVAKELEKRIQVYSFSPSFFPLSFFYACINYAIISTNCPL